jgi:molybdopterin/thiamine biosynthesis adenylyltransferase
VCAIVPVTLRRHYPEVEVVAVSEPVTAEQTSPFLAQADVVVDARHNFPERLLRNRLCVELGVLMVEAAMNGAEARSASLARQDRGPAVPVRGLRPRVEAFGFPRTWSSLRGWLAASRPYRPSRL